MRVAVVGAAGVFGARLVDLLARDGHELILCGRSEAPLEALAAAHGGRPLRLDRAGDLAPLLALSPEAVVDAAGPFQDYGADPYRCARAAIGAGAHYLDLSDDAGFTSGIAALDEAARAAGVFALSGASSTPGLSAAAASELCLSLARVELIETTILPGNRAPRGRAVTASILGQVGAPLPLWRGGASKATGWSDPKRYELTPGVTRTAWRIGSPETALFPDRFRARSSTFRAGLELAVMNNGLAALAWARRRGLIGDPRRLLGFLRITAQALGRFGTDRGGMVVEVVGRTADGRGLRRRWRLIAEEGEGPFVPATVVRAILRDPANVAPGARPCLGDASLAACEATMADLAVRFERDEAPDAPLFERALGPAFASLPAQVRDAHEVWDRRVFAGEARVDRGEGFVARAVAALFGFPAAAAAAPVRVLMERRGDGEVWERSFAGRRFRSRISPAGAGRVTEAFGPFAFDLDLPIRDGVLDFEVRRGRFLGIPLPRALLPRSESRETAEAGLFRFDVALHAPFGLGLIVRYRGWLQPEND